MGCSSSRQARGGAVTPPERRQSLRSLSLPRAASALSTLGLCRSGHDAVHAYSTLPSEEMMKGAPPGGGRAIVASVEDASPAEPRMAQCRGEPSLSSSPPPVKTLLDFDPAIVSGFQETVLGPSPSHPALLFPERENPPAPETKEEAFDDMGTPASRDIPEVIGFVRARVDEFQEKIEKKKRAAGDAADEVEPPSPVRPAKAAAAAAVYFTSLRGVRRTFEDCRAVRAILRCYRVRVDERDVSMHAAFKAELRSLLGADFAGPALPRVFARGRRDLGGADEVRALHEAGELALALAGCELPAAAGHAACAACGDMRFLPCETCCGSCKVFAGDEGRRQLAGMFLRCPDCNENGLVRCPACCY